ncbi:tyrosinase family oxidase copper chaperone [Streptomyces avermitilis]|uniref:tyrosinase family oxidase copper chaperone n=1 Tax=Streptomyces avermitilis TaxID=33903 RepID=UPI003F53F1E0
MAGPAVAEVASGGAVTGSVNTAADSASPGADSLCPRPAAHPTEATGRRRVLRVLFALGAGVTLAPGLAASGSSGPEQARFDETYRGRRIVGDRYDAQRSGDDHSGAWRVTVDGRPLHLMRRADGSWMTMVDHYRSYPTVLAASRAAVDELGPTARLGVPHGGGGHMDDSGTPGGRKRAERDHGSGVHA